MDTTQQLITDGVRAAERAEDLLLNVGAALALTDQGIRAGLPAPFYVSGNRYSGHLDLASFDDLNRWANWIGVDVTDRSHDDDTEAGTWTEYKTLEAMWLDRNVTASVIVHHRPEAAGA